MDGGWVSPTPWAPCPSSWSSRDIPGRSDPGELRDLGRRSLIIIMYYFLCNGGYETRDFVPGTTGNIRKMVPTSKNSRWEFLTRWARSHPATCRSAGNGGCRLGWALARGRQFPVIAHYLWEPRGRKGAEFGALLHHSRLRSALAPGWPGSQLELSQY